MLKTPTLKLNWFWRGFYYALTLLGIGTIIFAVFDYNSPVEQVYNQQPFDNVVEVERPTSEDWLKNIIEKTPEDDLVTKKTLERGLEKSKDMEELKLQGQALAKEVNRSIKIQTLIAFCMIGLMILGVGAYGTWRAENTFIKCLNNGLLVRAGRKKKVIPYNIIKKLILDWGEFTMPGYFFTTLKYRAPAIIIRADMDYPVKIHDWKGWAPFLEFLETEKGIPVAKEVVEFKQEKKIPTHFKNWKFTIFNWRNFVIMVVVILIWTLIRIIL